MTEDVHAQDGSSPVAAAVLPLPLEFEALYLANQEAYHRYALARLGSNEAAEAAVHRASLEILRHWEALLEESNLQQQTWSILRRVVISQRLDSFRHELGVLRSDIGLYKAMSSLPPRQFDAIVLRHILEYDTKRIGWYMGVTPSTVDYHCRKGKERLELAVSSFIQTKGESK
ncbi:RNA polymerase sigma factor [Streptomyces spectabilis]|uniref:RNA polymerase sigma factor n=1 Tax=Streptomyces spectabilis TaxID=68270 RepID=UPI001F622CAE|nr:sigma-70 family RNA polymerase sigma factor [Streptomyces spectabilis]MCI3907776.1 sigma-70 family RNA polymerase sigma factor [Streptomyces spectabilis]